MTGGVGQFAIDTLLATGLLIALVLVVRGAVTRWFGPQIAYALWALPLVRLFLPPLILPASMAPAAPMAADAAPALLAVSEGAAAPILALPAGEVLAGLWLAGAAALLIWRAWQYRAMRRTLLAEARSVGEAGRVRLVETPAADMPLAFGVFDKVVALPPGFMAQHNRVARDLAIAHELAHHRGHDLAANWAAQLVLALHWFNPLAWLGWQAMRKDQEAACDARVVAGRGREERAAYAVVIAGFAAGRGMPRTAPLASRILGEKSIIHRLRALTGGEISPTRRRLGLGTVAAGALALPLSATISYVQPEPPLLERGMVIVDVPAGAEPGDPALHSQAVQREDGPTIVLRTAQPVSTAEAQARVAQAFASVPDRPEPGAAPSLPVPGAQSEAGTLPTPGEQRRLAMIDRSGTGESVPLITHCADGEAGDCEVAVTGQTRTALQQARAAIASAPISEEARSEALREIDRDLARLRAGHASMLARPPVAVRSLVRVSLYRPAPRAFRLTIYTSAAGPVLTLTRQQAINPKRPAGPIA